MAYVLKHKETSEIFSCTLINVYDLPYHGVKTWEDSAAAASELGQITAAAGHDQPSLWEVMQLEENRLKLCNVKLNNDANRRVFLLSDGRLEARSDL